MLCRWHHLSGDLSGISLSQWTCVWIWQLSEELLHSWASFPHSRLRHVALAARNASQLNHAASFAEHKEGKACYVAVAGSER